MAINRGDFYRAYAALCDHQDSGYTKGLTVEQLSLLIQALDNLGGRRCLYAEKLRLLVNRAEPGVDLLMPSEGMTDIVVAVFESKNLA
ncbi:hypothetical protein [Myxococcus phage Mx1]|nr:hypothetical protein [Myxococcus phage Mx1]